MHTTEKQKHLLGMKKFKVTHIELWEEFYIKTVTEVAALSAEDASKMFDEVLCVEEII